MQNMDPLAINTDFSHLGFWIQGCSLGSKQAPARSQRCGSPWRGQTHPGPGAAPKRRVCVRFGTRLLDPPYREREEKKPSVLQHLFNQDFQTVQDIISHSTTLHNPDCDPKLLWQNPFKVLHSSKGGKAGSFTSRSCKIWAGGFLSLRFAVII